MKPTTPRLVTMSFLFVCLVFAALTQAGGSQSTSGPAAGSQSLQAMEAAGVKMSFDAASVKLNNPGDRGGHANVPLAPGAAFSRTGGLFSVANVPLPPLLRGHSTFRATNSFGLILSCRNGPFSIDLKSRQKPQEIPAKPKCN